MHDYSEYTSTPRSEDALAELSRLADVQREAERAVERAAEELKAREKELANVAEVQIPELMESLGMEEFTTTSGLKVSVTEKVRASILAANKARAFRWLRENGHAALIKRQVKLAFGMGQDELASDVIERLGGLDYEDKSEVHPSTLKSFVKELLVDGKEVPEDLFSVHRQRVSKIKT